MSNRLDKERQKDLEPKRVEFALGELRKLGLEITYNDGTRIDFIFKEKKVQFYPYSGWHTGKTIKDGRGWQNLYNQLIAVETKS